MLRKNNLHGCGWWICGRCGNWYPVTKMRWQNLINSLRCTGPGTRGCYDDPRKVLLSQRMEQIAQVLAQVPRYGEPEMESILASPNVVGSQGI